MANRRQLDRWLENTEWVADFDFDVSPDAVRCRPDPQPHHTESLSRRLCLPAPEPEPRALPARRRPGAAADLWASIGRGYRDLSETSSGH